MWFPGVAGYYRIQSPGEMVIRVSPRAYNRCVRRKRRVGGYEVCLRRCVSPFRERSLSPLFQVYSAVWFLAEVILARTWYGTAVRGVYSCTPGTDPECTGVGLVPPVPFPGPWIMYVLCWLL